MARRRVKRDKKIKPTFFVFCEGETEEAYVKFLRSHFRMASVVVKPSVTGNKISRKFINSSKQGQPTHPKDIDFLMYDLDVAGMFEKLNSVPNTIVVASNPCLELWFLLHYKNQRVAMDTNSCLKDLENRLGKSGYKKGVLNDTLQFKFSEQMFRAIGRAKDLKYPTNPSTQVWVLLEKLLENT